MCMRKVDFKLEYDKEVGDFVGYGWKALNSSYFNQTRKKNEWLEANANMSFATEEVQKTSEISTDYGESTYWPGFHIFLNKADAETYSRYNEVYQVAFTGVTSVGTNSCGADPRTGLHKQPGKCVIAQHMYIIGSSKEESLLVKIEKEKVAADKVRREELKAKKNGYISGKVKVTKPKSAPKRDKSGRFC